VAPDPDKFDRQDGVTLRDYFCTKLNALETKTDLHLMLNQIALDKAEEKMDERLLRMNEFRDTLRDQAATFVTRAEHKTVTMEIQGLRESRAKLEGKASALSVYILYGVSFASLAISAITMLLQR